MGEREKVLPIRFLYTMHHIIVPITLPLSHPFPNYTTYAFPQCIVSHHKSIWIETLQHDGERYMALEPLWIQEAYGLWWILWVLLCTCWLSWASQRARGAGALSKKEKSNPLTFVQCLQFLALEFLQHTDQQIGQHQVVISSLWCKGSTPGYEFVEQASTCCASCGHLSLLWQPLLPLNYPKACCSRWGWWRLREQLK